MEIVKPRWSSATFLVYAGGLTVLLAAASALQYLSASFGDAAYAAWALLLFVVLLGIALGKRERVPVVSGVFGVAALVAFGAFVVALWQWFGWSAGGSAFDGLHLARLVAELLILFAAFVLLATFRFPLFTFAIAAVGWFFATDLVSNGGGWSATVTLLFGLTLLLAGVALDGTDLRPYGFWVHVVAGLLVGGALLYWWHSSTWEWILVVLVALVYVWLASATGRSSWAVLGALGLAAAATHFALEWWQRSIPFISQGSGSTRGWVPPVVFAVLGFVLVALGVGVSRRERE